MASAAAPIFAKTHREPPGRVTITDKLDGRRFSGSYGCCILALSGRQLRLPRGWRGGNRLAVHGTSQPWTVGKPVSAGCLRMRSVLLRRLCAPVPLGTTVIVRR